MKDALVLVHLPGEDHLKFDQDLIEKIKHHAREYVANGKPVLNLLNSCAPIDLGIEGITTILPMKRKGRNVEQILDTEEVLMARMVKDVELCGLYRDACVDVITRCLQGQGIGLPHKPEHIDRVTALNGYSVDVTIIEDLCIRLSDEETA
jgi:hypothetical protein